MKVVSLAIRVNLPTLVSMNRFKRTLFSVIIICLVSICATVSYAHEDKHEGNGLSAIYLGNEGVLISTAVGKVLFDPFFHNDYGSYQLVPESIRKDIFDGNAPYDDIDVIIISHAHGDHFSAEDSLAYLQKHEKTKLLAPQQAISLVQALEGSDELASQLIAVKLSLGDQPKNNSLGAIEVESVRIPHAGWPSRKDVSNLVHRVSFRGKLSVIHMGDADPNDIHFKPYKSHWEKSKSSLAFPPYWFFTSKQGPMILSKRINTDKSVGVHVPTDVPSDLKESGGDYFSKPGEHRNIGR